MSLMNIISTYSIEKLQFDKERNYFIHRPLHSIKESGAKVWWRYAIRAICKLNKSKKEEVKEGLISKGGSEFYRKKFIAVFMKDYMKIAGTVELDKAIYEKALFLHNLETIFKWAKEAVYQVERDAQEEKNKKPSGLLGGFFGWGAAKKEVKEEAKETIEDKFKRLYQLAIKESHNETKEKFLIPSFATNLSIDTTNIELYTSIEVIKGQFNIFKAEIKNAKEKLEGGIQVNALNVFGIRMSDKEAVSVIKGGLDIKESCLSVFFICTDLDKEIKLEVSSLNIL